MAKTRSTSRTPAKNNTVVGNVTSKNDAPVTNNDQDTNDQKGYAGTGDHATGNYNTDPAQATPEQIKERS